jgi:hypothetical protein
MYYYYLLLIITYYYYFLLIITHSITIIIISHISTIMIYLPMIIINYIILVSGDQIHLSSNYIVIFSIISIFSILYFYLLYSFSSSIISHSFTHPNLLLYNSLSIIYHQTIELHIYLQNVIDAPLSTLLYGVFSYVSLSIRKNLIHI